MMRKLRDMLRYLLYRYPHKEELTVSRVVRLLFLADWCSVLRFGRTISEIDWYFDHQGPSTDRVLKEARDDRTVNVVESVNTMGAPILRFQLRSFNNEIDLDKEERDCIDFVIEKTERLYWNDLTNLVYSTFPILTTDKNSFLKLSDAKTGYDPSVYKDPIAH